MLHFSSHLITPKAPEAKLDNKPVETDNAAKLSKNQAPPELDSETMENASTPM